MHEHHAPVSETTSTARNGLDLEAGQQSALLAPIDDGSFPRQRVDRLELVGQIVAATNLAATNRRFTWTG